MSQAVAEMVTSMSCLYVPLIFTEINSNDQQVSGLFFPHLRQAHRHISKNRK